MCPSNLLRGTLRSPEPMRFLEYQSVGDLAVLHAPWPESAWLVPKTGRLLLGLPLEGDRAICLRMRRARQAATQVFADVVPEERRRAETTILAHVHELVREELGRGRTFRGNLALGLRPEKNASAEDDRAHARGRRQDARNSAAVETGALDMRSEGRMEPRRERRRNPRPGQGIFTTRRASFGATRSV